MPALATVRKGQSITRPLKTLIPLIKADLERGDRAAMEAYADAGDKLIEAKAQVSYGYWGSWLSKNFDLKDGTARKYMRAARLRAEKRDNGIGDAVLPSSLKEMTGDTKRATRQRQSDAAYKAALRDVEPDLYTQEQQTRADETNLHREMALELIDIGFKALATRLHPDRGGSKEAMSRLNRVRGELIGIAKTRRFI